MGPTCSGFIENIGQGITVCIPDISSTTDHWIQESMKQIINSGLFWAVHRGCREKKSKLPYVHMQLLRSGFLCIHGQKTSLKNIVAYALKSYIA